MFATVLLPDRFKRQSDPENCRNAALTLNSRALNSRVSLAKSGKLFLPGAQASLPATSLPQRRDELEIQAAQVWYKRRSDVCCRQGCLRSRQKRLSVFG